MLRCTIYVAVQQIGRMLLISFDIVSTLMILIQGACIYADIFMSYPASRSDEKVYI